MYKVLLVDDEALILEGMKLVINWEELGLEVTGEAQSGSTALEFIENNTVDILITDIKMPSMNGLELLKIIKERHSGIKAIILSGHDDFEYVKRAAKYGIENYLLKPVNDEELLSTLLLITKKLEIEEKTQQRQKQDISIIRENILLRWLTDTITSKELENRGDLLDLTTKGTTYVTCIVHGSARLENDGCQYPERYQSAIAEICAKLIGNETAYGFKNLDGDVVLLFHSSGLVFAYDDMLTILQKIMQEISRQIGIQVFILIGSQQTGYSNAHVSYSDALKLMDYSLILSGSHIVDFRRNQQEINCLETEQFIDFAELKRLIMEKDISSVNRYISEVYDRLGNFERLTPAMIRSMTIRIGLFTLNLASVAKITSKGFLEGTDAVFADIWEKKSLESLEAWVKSVAGTVVAFLLSANKVYSPVVKKVVHYIDVNYDKEIALKCIAGLLNMNPVYLGQLFKSETGLMFTVYLNNRRVEEAKKLLLTTKMNVSDIGIKVGYSNNNHFFSVFKKLVSVSPTEYRRLNLNF